MMNTHISNKFQGWSVENSQNLTLAHVAQKFIFLRNVRLIKLTVIHLIIAVYMDKMGPFPPEGGGLICPCTQKKN